jgi:hypothetical protein
VEGRTEVAINPFQIEQGPLNVILNATQAAPSRRRAGVREYLDEREAVVEVAT